MTGPGDDRGRADAERRALVDRARALAAEGRIPPALEAWNRRIALGGMAAAEWCEVGRLLAGVGEHAQAIRCHEQGLAVDPESAEVHHHLGQACFKLGDVDRATEHLFAAARRSDRLASWLALATLVPGAPEADGRTILGVRRAFAERLARDSTPRERRAPAARRPGDDRVRVGYVSAFFHRANYMKPVWALVNRHDRSRLSVHLLSDSAPEDGMEGYEGHPEDGVHHVGDLDNDGLADRIAGLGIDVLVDLNGYSAPERLGLFLAPPAPACVAWFNMYATSGLPGIHWIVGDEEVAGPEEASLYSERLVLLPVSYLTFEVPHRAPPVAEPPCLREGAITFGSLAAQYKVNRGVISAWARILRGAEGSRLRIANRALDSAENRRWLAARFEAEGVDPGRLSLSGSAPHYEYLQHYDRIDVALDPFPYNGGTTTMEALWQGVPVLTFDGDRWASRTSRTLIRRTHLGEFVARDVDDMVDAAVRLAADPATPERLAGLRRTMRDRLAASPACDASALARAMEAFYESAAAGSKGAG